MRDLMRWALAMTLLACGARSDLSSLPIAGDAGGTIGSDDAATAHDVTPVPDEPCTAVEYATKHFTTARFSVDATGVYFMVDASTLARVPKTGGEPVTVHSFSDKDWLGESFVTDGTTIFWAGGTYHLFALPESGGTSKTLGTGGTTLGVNDDVIVIQVAPLMSQLGMLAKAGGEVTMLSPEIAPTAPVLEAFVDAKRIYWMTGEHVFALDLAAHGTLATFGGWPTGIAIDDDHVYWATLDDVVRYAKKDNTAGGVLEGHARGPIAAGKDAIFGVGQGGIVRVPKGGGAAQLIEALPDAGGTPNQIVADGNCVYYSTTKGKLARLPQ